MVVESRRERMIHIVRMKMDKQEVESLRSFKTEEAAREYLRREILRQYGYFDKPKGWWKKEELIEKAIKNLQVCTTIKGLLKYRCTGEGGQPEFHAVWN